VNNWKTIIQHGLYPPTCLLCGDPGGDGRDLCRPCANALPLNRPACPRCAEALGAETDCDCGQCQKRAPAFDASFAAFRYEEPVRHLIHALKFGARYPSARLLGELLAQAVVAGRRPLPEALLPVPLHPSRYRERGFNQAAEIARSVSAFTGIPLDLNSCIRNSRTQPQAELSAEERTRNIRHAFAVKRVPTASHIAIVDDVVTTGATVNELAKCLRAAGVRRIDVWACARA
jgi:ComF family protein